MITKIVVWPVAALANYETIEENNAQIDDNKLFCKTIFVVFVKHTEMHKAMAYSPFNKLQ